MNSALDSIQLEKMPALTPGKRENRIQRLGKSERYRLTVVRPKIAPDSGDEGEVSKHIAQPNGAPVCNRLKSSIHQDGSEKSSSRIQLNAKPVANGRSVRSTRESKSSRKDELWFFAVLIFLLNLPLLNGTWNSAFAFHPELVRDGEWWRVLTFPFVHVSIYHLLLDAAAFFLLYSGLREPRRWNRLAFVFASALGSLLISLFAAPQINSVGLCGLSGVAHGLMAISALEMMQTNADKKIVWAGTISFLFVTSKAAWEAVTGQVVFSHLHFGNLGTPIAVCHAGGILGAIFVWRLINYRLSPAQRTRHETNPNH